MVRLGFILLVTFGLAEITSLNVSHAQDLNFKLGYGSFAMEDMKDLQQSFLTDDQIPFQVTESFPSYYLFALQYHHPWKDWMDIGGSIEYKSTGGRVYYADYSGSASVDQLLSGFSFSLSASAYLTKNEKFAIPVYLLAGATYTNLRIASQVNIGGQTVKDNFEAVSTALFIEPGIRYQRNLSMILLSFECGYEINFASGLHLPSDSNAKLVNNQGENITADWSGVRLRAGIGYRFGAPD